MARKSIVLPLAIGCQISTGPVDRAGNQGDLGQLVAPVLHPRRDRVVLAAVGELLLVERLPHELELLLEQLEVGRRVEEGRAEGLDLARVVAAADPHDDAPAGQDVGDRVVLGQADRVPHREDVERAAELELARHRGEVRADQDQVREDLVALALEVVLGGPEAVVARVVHHPRDVDHRAIGLDDPLVRVAPLVRGRAVAADVVEVDLADVQDGELADHGAPFPRAAPVACHGDPRRRDSSRASWRRRGAMSPARSLALRRPRRARAPPACADLPAGSHGGVRGPDRLRARARRERRRGRETAAATRARSRRCARGGRIGPRRGRRPRRSERRRRRSSSRGPRIADRDRVLMRRSIRVVEGERISMASVGGPSMPRSLTRCARVGSR